MSIFEAGDGFLREGDPVNVYPFIEADNARRQGTVTRACQLLGISRAAYYNHRTRAATGGSTRQRTDMALTEKIIAAHDRSRGTYGAPRIQAELAAQGHRHSRKRIARLMQQAGRTGRAPRWCGDITYIPTGEGWLYLATVLDLASRRVVGWATADHLHTDLPDQALRNALHQRRPQPGVIFHSDRGCQYTSQQYAHTARQAGIRLSVGRRGQCWDNAVAESFFATLKTELLHHHTWPTRATAHHALFTWIEGWYNTHRRHSSLNYQSPATYETTTT